MATWAHAENLNSVDDLCTLHHVLDSLNILGACKPLSAAYVTVGLRYISITVHKFPRDTFRNMLYPIPQVSLHSFHTPPAKHSSGAQGEPQQAQVGVPGPTGLILLQTLDWASASWVLGKICAQDQRNPQDILHVDKEEKNSMPRWQ